MKLDMNLALYVAAFLTVVLGVAHSYLGERYILQRLFRRGELPKTLGSTEFTTRTLRFAWHLTSVAWLGFATILVLMAHAPAEPSALGLVIGCTFLVHFGVTAFASRGKHLAWPVFLAIGIIAMVATRA